MRTVAGLAVGVLVLSHASCMTAPIRPEHSDEGMESPFVEAMDTLEVVPGDLQSFDLAIDRPVDNTMPTDPGLDTTEVPDLSPPDIAIAEDRGEDDAAPGDPGRDADAPADPGRDDAVPGDLGQDDDAPADPGRDDAASGDTGQPCGFVTSAFGFRDNCDGTVLDTSTGLTWEKSFHWSAGLDEASSLCVQSRTGGLGDWRLPTIDELRSLVVGCPATEPEGGCVVHHADFTCEDHQSATCFSEDCYGCTMNQGPVVNPAKPTQRCYMDASFDWYCNLFWSSTRVKAKNTGDRRSWYLTFYNAGIDVPPSMSQVQSSALRCVRGP